MSPWLPYSISQCSFQSSHYCYPYSPFLLPLSVSSRHVSLPSTLPLYQFLQQEYLVLLISTNPSRSISHHLFVPISRSLSVISFFYFDNYFSLSLLLYPANFFAFKSSSLPRNLSLTIFFFSHLYVTVSFWYSLSVCLCLSNYLWFFVSLSVCSAVLPLSVTPLTLSM